NLGIPLAPLRRARRKESVDTEWARIGVVTKKLWSKESQWHNHSARNGPPTSRGCCRRLRAPMATGPMALEPPSSPLPFPTDINPGAALSWPENRVFRRRFVRSYPNFQLEILPRFSTKSIDQAPGARQKCKRDLREVEAIEVRGIHHRASQSFRTTKGDSAEFSAEV
ncbi:aldose 1-epimerase family protein, partial [Prunus dulcis]